MYLIIFGLLIYLCFIMVLFTRNLIFCILIALLPIFLKLCLREFHENLILNLQKNLFDSKNTKGRLVNISLPPSDFYFIFHA